MIKRMFTRLRDPCPNCLVISACTVSCEDKRKHERQEERRGALRDPVKLIFYTMCLIVLIPVIWVYLLFSYIGEKIGTI
jgi:hypothetical protein